MLCRWKNKISESGPLFDKSKRAEFFQMSSGWFDL